MTIEILHIPEKAQVPRPANADAYALRGLYQQAVMKLAEAGEELKLTWTRLEQGVHTFGSTQTESTDQQSTATIVEVYSNGMGAVIRPDGNPVVLGTTENSGQEIMITSNPQVLFTDIVRHVPEDQDTPTHPSGFVAKDS